MNCADVEILLAEYVDGTLRREAKGAVKQHLETCVACRDLAHDAAGAVAFIERASRVDAPPELMTRLLFEVTQGSSHAVVKRRRDGLVVPGLGLVGRHQRGQPHQRVGSRVKPGHVDGAG